MQNPGKERVKQNAMLFYKTQELCETFNFN